MKIGIIAAMSSERKQLTGLLSDVRTEHHPITLLRRCEDAHDRHTPVLVFPLVHGEVPSREP